jgi:hypothetical protein
MDTIKPAQTLTETWEVVFIRRPWHWRGEHPIEARLSWPHSTIYATSGQGKTIDEARLDLVLKLAGAIADDPMTEPPVREESVRRLVNAARRGLRARLRSAA